MARGRGLLRRTVLAVAAGLVALGLTSRLASAAEPGDELTISVLTFGRGDHPFYKFGHNAILVRDALRGRDDVYNYGTFDFHSANRLGHFLLGRLHYWLSVQSLTSTLAHYRAENRTIAAQELSLDPAQRRLLADRLVRNALPENRAYRYDYYRDNCSTRVRDVLDDILRGRLRQEASSPALLSMRGHTERLTADDPAVSLALDAAMGDVVDRPISEWEEMFLPSKLQELLRRTTVTTAAGEAPLVAHETVLFAAHRPPSPASPPRWNRPMALLGLAGGAGYAVLGAVASTRRAARVAFGLLLGVFALLTGALGSLFVFLWIATDHVVAHHNENILQCSPIALALAAAGAGVAFGRPWAIRATQVFAGVVAGSSALGLVLKALPWFDQVNGHIVALLFPLWCGAAIGSWRLSAPRSPQPYS